MVVSRCENNRAMDWGGVSHYMMGRRSVPTHSVHGEMRVCCAIVCGVGWDWGGRGESKILSNLERGAAKSFAVPLAQGKRQGLAGIPGFAVELRYTYREGGCGRTIRFGTEGSGKVMIGRVGKPALVSCRIDQSIGASIIPLIFNVRFC